MSHEFRFTPPPKPELLAKIDAIVPPEWINPIRGLGTSGVHLDYMNQPLGGVMFLERQWNSFQGKGPGLDAPTQEKLQNYYGDIPTYNEYLQDMLQHTNKVRLEQGKPSVDSESVINGLFAIIPQAKKLVDIALEMRIVASSGSFAQKETVERILRLLAESSGITHSPEDEQRVLERFGLSKPVGGSGLEFQ